MSQVILPPVKEGQIYLHGRINKHGDVEHTVLIGINNDKLPRDQQREYAKSIGGVLYNRIDALIVQAEHPGLLLPDAYYWTDDDCSWDSAYAWCQGSGSGYQGLSRKSAALRAVVVSRFTN